MDKSSFSQQKADRQKADNQKTHGRFRDHLKTSKDLQSELLRYSILAGFSLILVISSLFLKGEIVNVWKGYSDTKWLIYTSCISLFSLVSSLLGTLNMWMKLQTVHEMRVGKTRKSLNKIDPSTKQIEFYQTLIVLLVIFSCLIFISQALQLLRLHV